MNRQQLTDGRESFAYLRKKPKMQRLDIAPFLLVYLILSYLAIVARTDPGSPRGSALLQVPLPDHLLRARHGLPRGQLAHELEDRAALREGSHQLTQTNDVDLCEEIHVVEQTKDGATKQDIVKKEFDEKVRPADPERPLLLPLPQEEVRLRQREARLLQTQACGRVSALALPLEHHVERLQVCEAVRREPHGLPHAELRQDLQRAGHGPAQLLPALLRRALVLRRQLLPPHHDHRHGHDLDLLRRGRPHDHHDEPPQPHPQTPARLRLQRSQVGQTELGRVAARRHRQRGGSQQSEGDRGRGHRRRQPGAAAQKHPLR